MQRRVELIRGKSVIRVTAEHVDFRKSRGWGEKPRPRGRRTKPQESKESDE